MHGYRTLFSGPYINCLPKSCSSSLNLPTSIRKFSSEGSIHSSQNTLAKASWDHVFTELDEIAPLLPSSRVTRPASSSSRPVRRQTMTAREIRAFDEMFDMIFDSAVESKGDVTTSRDSDVDGVKSGGVSDLLGRLRRHSKRMRWTSETDEELDRKKEAIDLCDTDQQLLEWAMREVFAESQRYEETARRAALEASKSSAVQELPGLQPPAYPHLIALLMRVFRDKFRDPYLALSIFDHAKNLSIVSYVFGCSTQAYNELLETRWSCFRDLKSVHDVLEEMKVNGVAVDSTTRKIVDNLRREIGEENLWAQEHEAGGDVWSMLEKIVDLVARRSGKSAKKMKWTDWKAKPLADDPNDKWGFDRWDMSPRPRKTKSSLS